MCTCKTVENVHPYGDTTATETMVELCDDCANLESLEASLGDCRCEKCGTVERLTQVCDGECVCADCLADEAELLSDLMDERAIYAGDL
jgi:hypothetical protein